VNLNLVDRTVVVTGGSRGIGLACARVFLEEGCRVALVAKSHERLLSAVETLGAPADRLRAYEADLSDPRATATVFATIERDLGLPDILVNSAGAAQRHGPGDLSSAVYQAALDAKFFPTINAIDAVLKGMVARGAGVIVNVIGMGGKVAATSHIAGGAANSALMLVTAGLGKAYAGQGVRVVGVNPGRTLTDRVQAGLTVEAQVSGVTFDEARRRAEAEIPLGRFARPDEVATLVLFLASDAGAYLTGTTISMDGGASGVL